MRRLFDPVFSHSPLLGPTRKPHSTHCRKRGSSVRRVAAPERPYSRTTRKPGLFYRMAFAVIVNPAAGRGGIRAKIDSLLETFRAYGIDKVFQTSALGEEETLAQRAINEGATTIVAVGGDG